MEGSSHPHTRRRIRHAMQTSYVQKPRDRKWGANHLLKDSRKAHKIRGTVEETPGSSTRAAATPSASNTRSTRSSSRGSTTTAARSSSLRATSAASGRCTSRRGPVPTGARAVEHDTEREPVKQVPKANQPSSLSGHGKSTRGPRLLTRVRDRDYVLMGGSPASSSSARSCGTCSRSIDM